jgi:hypothetical protein
MTLAVSGESITFNDSSVQTTAATGFGFKNRIINGAMVIDQRNAGASVTLGAGGTYTVDRWQGYEDSDGVMTAQQDLSAPTGFINSLKFTTTTADPSLASTQFVLIQHKIEGFNIADLAWGTASAATVTLSFWVRSSLIGTFGGSLRNSAQNRSYPFTYTISVADTWEQKSVTIAGDTSGTWSTTNGIGIQVAFGLGVGSPYSGTAGSWSASQYFSATGATSVVGTNGATFYITGVQLEKGSTATSFDYRPYGTEFSLCQRYFQKSYNQSVVPGTASTTVGQIAILANNSTFGEFLQMRFPVTMRASPTMVTFNPSSGASGSIRNNTASSNVTASINNSAESGLSNLDSALTSGSVYTAQYTASAEL